MGSAIFLEMELTYNLMQNNKDKRVVNFILIHHLTWPCTYSQYKYASNWLYQKRVYLSSYFMQSKVFRFLQWRLLRLDSSQGDIKSVKSAQSICIPELKPCVLPPLRILNDVKRNTSSKLCRNREKIYSCQLTAAKMLLQRGCISYIKLKNIKNYS